MNRGERVWEIMHLWYRDAYEVSEKHNVALMRENMYLVKQMARLKRSRDLLQTSNRMQQTRLRYYSGVNNQQRNLLNEIFVRFPEAEAAYAVILNQSESESEVETEEDELI